MSGNRSSLVLATGLITVGTGSLLSSLGLMPQINWIWTLGLALTGGLTLALLGRDKVTVVAGPFFILTSALSVLRQVGHLSFDVEVPVLVLASGVLVLLSRLQSIPNPKWLIEDDR